MKEKESQKLQRMVIIAIACVMCLLCVFAESAEAKSKIKLNKTKATIYVGKSIKLKVKGTKKKVKWSSSNKKIAKVTQKGKVTGVKNGTAKITAKVGKKKYKCKVTVKKKGKKTTEQTTTEQTTAEQTTEENDNSTSENENGSPTVNNQVKIQSIVCEYGEAIIDKGTSYPEIVAEQLGITLYFSDGTNASVDEYGNTGYLKVSDIDTDVVGDYDATLTCTYGGASVSIPIKISVCDKQENSEYRYISNGRIAIIHQYIGEEENISVPEKIGNAEVIGGYLIDYYDTSVKSIVLPKTWRTKRMGLLFESKILESITVDADNKYFSSIDGVLFDKSQKILLKYPSAKADISYSIPNTVTEIRQGAFRYMSKLESLTIPKTVTTISKSVQYAVCQFSYETALKEIIVEEGNPYYKAVDGVLFVDYEYYVDGIKYRAYDLLHYPSAKGETQYNIPEGVQYISSDAFRNTVFLNTLVIPSSVGRWGNTVFGDLSDTSILDIYIDMDEVPNNGYIPNEVVADGRTIYVRNQHMKELIENIIEEKHYVKNCVVSDQFDW